jgi:carboxymethylenebutenolidase
MKPTDEAYRLYDRYCHGDIDRRAFFDGLGRIAGGAAAASAMAAALLPNYAMAQQVKPDDPRIRTERLSYNSPKGGGKMQGLLARPKEVIKVPAVLVVHENRGLNPYIEDVARRLALEGYVAFAPDALFPLGGYPGNDDEGRAMQQKRDRREMVEDFRAAALKVQSHQQSTGELGAVGFCFGGYVVNELAVTMDELGAAVPYYGGWPEDAQAENLTCPLMVHLAGLDDRVNAGWPGYEKALMDAGKSYSAHVYEDVNHGFHNDSTSRYDEEAAELSWDRTLAFFQEHLT